MSSVDRLQDAAGVLPLLCLYEQSLMAVAFNEVFVLDLKGFWRMRCATASMLRHVRAMDYGENDLEREVAR